MVYVYLLDDDTKMKMNIYLEKIPHLKQSWMDMLNNNKIIMEYSDVKYIIYQDSEDVIRISEYPISIDTLIHELIHRYRNVNGKMRKNLEGMLIAEELIAEAVTYLIINNRKSLDYRLRELYKNSKFTNISETTKSSYLEREIANKCSYLIGANLAYNILDHKEYQNIMNELLEMDGDIRTLYNKIENIEKDINKKIINEECKNYISMFL